MAASLTAKKPAQQTGADPPETLRDLKAERDLARAVARECLEGWRQRAHFDQRAMERIRFLAQECLWLKDDA